MAAGAERTRVATCRCGQLRAICTGEPVRASVCHCLDCQRRSGSAFAAQARWPDASVALRGAFVEYTPGDDGRARATFRFCAICGGTVAYRSEGVPGFSSVPIGGFADPAFPAPSISVFEARRLGWVAVAGEDIVHVD